MNEPQREVSSVAPSSLKHLVGMKHIVDQVQVAIDASFADDSKFPHTLLVSEPGLGKSELCNVIRHEMAVGMHTVLGLSISHISDLNSLLLGAKDKDIIYINECDNLKAEFQVALYLAIDQGKLVLSGGRSGRSPQSIRIPDVTFLIDTNFEFSLLPALRDRMKQTLYVPFYEQHELAEILRRRVRALGWSVEEEVFPLLASLAKGTPRQVLRLLSASHRVSRSQEESTVTLAHANRAVALEGLDEMGLSAIEQAYLRVVAEGANRLNVISSKIGMATRSVQTVVEPYLIRSGLIEKDDGRRQLSEKGREHLSNSRRDGA